MVFDILYAPDAGSLLAEPLAERRAALDRFRATAGAGPMLRLSPCTSKRGEAERWLEVVGAAIDGVVAKGRDGVYVPGERARRQGKRPRPAGRVVERGRAGGRG